MKNIATRNLELDAAFWSYFFRNHWEKKPLALQKIRSPIAEIDADYIFELLLRYSDRCRSLGVVDGLKLFVNGERQYDEEILQILPVKKDKSLLGYHQRMEKIFSDYCLVCDELLQVSHEKWDVTTNFLRGLYKKIGLPNRFAEIGLYLGNYRTTPFGVHVDGCGVFSFPVVGTKKFRLWSPEYAKKNPGLIETHNYARFKKHSKLITAEPGDMTYWPSSAWHIAESDGRFNATWSLGVWLDRPHLEDIMDAIKPLLAAKVGDPGDSRSTVFEKLSKKNGEVTGLPELYEQTKMKVLSLTSGELGDALKKNWMLRVSRQGLKIAPVRAPGPRLNLRDKVQIRSGQEPVLWSSMKQKSKQLFVFNGILVEHSGSKELLALIKDLNGGQVCLLSQYLRGPKKREGLNILQKLADAGAVCKVSAL